LQAKKKKENTNRRALTGAEVSEHQEKVRTRAQTRAQVAQKAAAKQRHMRFQNAADILEGRLQADAAHTV
jgi:hypothetical protein